MQPLGLPALVGCPQGKPLPHRLLCAGFQLGAAQRPPGSQPSL
jgi:hypothetical protein